MKITNYLLALASFLIIYSCNDDDDPTPFDHAGQAVIDKQILQDFLKTHYYTAPTSEENFGKIDTITNGETPLFDQVISEDVDYGDITYTIYHLNSNEGSGVNPINVDSTLVNYKGRLLYATEDELVFDENTSYSFWANLYGGVVPGWSFLIPEFKSGTNISQEDAPIAFENTGKGVIFMPSGLGYREAASIAIPASSPLIFHVELAMVKHNDQDRDGIKSIYEDVDHDNNVGNDDTDSDNNANFVDYDDDGDGLSTQYEYADDNGDGNPDDAIDTDNDGTPDYLDDDDDGDGILTINEDADPNKDGNPDDAVDTDGDSIPDYLDNN